jgi:hypothetical protein
VMLIAFLVAVGINLRRGRKISCGCFGNANEQISSRTVARLLLLLTVVLLLLALRSMENTALLNLGTMMADGSTLMYLLQTAFLAASLILLASWMLSLPELVVLIRHLPWSQPITGNRKEGDGTEVA